MKIYFFLRLLLHGYIYLLFSTLSLFVHRRRRTYSVFLAFLFSPIGDVVIQFVLHVASQGQEPARFVSYR